MTARLPYKSIICLALSALFTLAAAGQLPQYQLNRIQEEGGLKTSDVINLERDGKGFMWLASQSYVHQFDGRHSVQFSFTETVSRIVIDAHDRKWVLTRTGIFLYSDSLRGFRQIVVEEGKGNPAGLYETSDGQLTAVIGGGYFIFQPGQQKFVRAASPLAKAGARVNRYFGKYGESVFFANADSVFRYNQQTKQLAFADIGHIYSIVPLNDEEVLVSTRRFKTFFVHLGTGEIRLLGNAQDSIGNNLVLYSGLLMKDADHLLCSNKGLLVYDAVTHAIRRPVFYYDGRPLENQSSATSLYKDEAGNMYMNHADGIFFFSSRTNFIQYFRNYRFGNEQLAGNDVRNFAEDEKGNIWMATASGLSKLDMQTGELKSFDPLSGSSMIEFPSYRQLVDDGPYLWIGTSGNGLWLYDKQSGQYKRPAFAGTEDHAASFNQAYTWKLLKLASGNMLVVGGISFFMVDRTSLTARRLPIDLQGAISRAALQDASGRIWHGTIAGLTCFDTAFNALFKVRDSFPDKRVASFCEWQKDKMLVGSKGLFEIALRGNAIVSFKRMKAIPAEQFIYCMKQDRQGFVWLGTDEGLYRYDPVKDESIMFDRSDHVQSQAFNSDAAFLSSRLLFMGGKNGVNYFDPAAFSPEPAKLQPLVLSFAVDIDDSTMYSPNYQVPYSSRNIDFIISAPELKKPFRLQYRYRLRGADRWTNTGFNNHVRISRLQPGDYVLQVSASYDGKTWFNGKEQTMFTVMKPWWQTGWFRAICVLAGALAVWALLRYRRKKREAAEMKSAVDYFTYQGSDESSVKLILWDIARNCISRLGFGDCVIYLLDESRNVLVQKAAYGAKNPRAFEISNPIEIAVGQGITGHVAQTCMPLMVNDTSKDERYIVDDEQRSSELAVPIIHDGKLVGVIDSEHSRKNFFTRHHLKTLETIASLCASRIATAAALEAARKAETELQVLNGKMMESKFINLRLQMNPHFLFNILTTIQYLIVSNQVNKATRYLDIFSGFLRSLLSYAEETVVTLEDELRILTMYVDLESLCLDETFVWDINVEETIDADEVLVPFMLLQPFVENAINHGLIHKIGEKRFSITVKEHDADSLMCIIRDSGIGRQASADINRKKLAGALHQSKGIGIVQKRLELLQQKTNKRACFEIEDLYANGAAAGTCVSIIIPYYSNEEI